MPCTQTNLSPITVTAPTPVLSKAFSPISGQRLYVCDNPEPLSPERFTSPIITLWDDSVPSSTSVKYRVFMWHHNDMSTTIKYGLTLGNAGSGAITVSSIKYETTVTSNTGDILTNGGLCLAKALLGGTLISDSSSITVASNSVKTIKEFTLAPGQVRGLVMEFTLSSTSAMVAKIRSLAGNSTSSALNTHQGAVVNSVNSHPRGTWNYADVQGANITLSLGSSGISNSVSVLDDDPSVFPGTLPNSAAYGGIYKTNITITNTSGSTQTANLYLNPRGGKFVGAVKVGSNPVYGISKTLSFTEAVKIGGFSLSNGQSITVPVQVTAGGGSSTPIAFFVRNS